MEHLQKYWKKIGKLEEANLSQTEQNVAKNAPSTNSNTNSATGDHLHGEVEIVCRRMTREVKIDAVSAGLPLPPPPKDSGKSTVHQVPVSSECAEKSSAPMKHVQDQGDPVPVRPPPEPAPVRVVPEPAPVRPTPEPAPVRVVPQLAPVRPTPEPAPVRVVPEPAPLELPPEPEAVPRLPGENEAQGQDRRSRPSSIASSSNGSGFSGRRGRGRGRDGDREDRDISPHQAEKERAQAERRTTYDSEYLRHIREYRSNNNRGNDAAPPRAQDDDDDFFGDSNVTDLEGTYYIPN